MVLLVGSLTIGLILAVLALGVLISFRIFSFSDITVDGSLTLGGAVAATMIVAGWRPEVATAAAFLAGMLAGATTGVLHTRFGIDRLLSGILVMTGLYSINLRIMGKSNVPLLDHLTLASMARGWAGDRTLLLLGWEVDAGDIAVLFGALAVVALVAFLVNLFFQTQLGLSLRAAGDNAQMTRAQGVDVGWMITLGLALGNGLAALAGALFVQYQGFADVQMGIGMVVLGLASVIIGEAMVGARPLYLALAGAVMGSVLFRLLVAIALQRNLDPNDLRLATALFVFAALVLPKGIESVRDALRRRANAGN